MVSVEVERVLVPKVSFHSEMWFLNPPLQSPPDKLPPELHQTWAKEIKAVEEEQHMYRMFKDLKDMYGWIMFRKTFTMMRDDSIDLQRIGENPSTLRTSYVTAYLTLGAGEDISDYFHSSGVPTFDPEMMQAIIVARKGLIDLGDNATAVGWSLFRQGNYKEILKAIERPKN